MKISNLTEDISLEIEDEVVREFITFRLIFDQRRLCVIAGVDHLVHTEFADQLLVPTDEVDITV